MSVCPKISQERERMLRQGECTWEPACSLCVGALQRSEGNLKHCPQLLHTSLFETGFLTGTYALLSVGQAVWFSESQVSSCLYLQAALSYKQRPLDLGFFKIQVLGLKIRPSCLQQQTHQQLSGILLTLLHLVLLWCVCVCACAVASMCRLGQVRNEFSPSTMNSED